LRPDITILHAQRCDRHGNAHLWGNLGISLEAARAAETVLLTCEELVDDAIITSDPNRTLVPGFLVSAVAEEPFGSHPSPTQGYVNRDDRFYDEYHEETRARAGFLAWLDRMVLGTRGHAGYLSRLGEDRMERLRPRTTAGRADPHDGRAPHHRRGAHVHDARRRDEPAAAGAGGRGVSRRGRSRPVRQPQHHLGGGQGAAHPASRQRGSGGHRRARAADRGAGPPRAPAVSRAGPVSDLPGLRAGPGMAGVGGPRPRL